MNCQNLLNYFGTYKPSELVVVDYIVVFFILFNIFVSRHAFVASQYRLLTYLLTYDMVNKVFICCGVCLCHTAVICGLTA